MKVSILGSNSCFGINLARHLVDRGDIVLGISRSPMRTKPFTMGLEDESRFSLRVGHLGLQLDEVMVALDEFRPEVIINFAALCELNYSWTNPEHYFDTNTMTMVRLVKQLQPREWLRRFIQVGTSEVYGSVTNPSGEDDPIRCSSPYAASKAAFDLHLIAVAKHQGFPAVIIRPSNGYCEGQPLNRIIPRTILCALNHTKLLLQGGGKAEKSFMHADDISSAIMLLMAKGQSGEIYNAGPSYCLSVKSLVTLVARMYGLDLEDVAQDAPERMGQDSRYWLASDKITSLGWTPAVEFMTGLARLRQWFEKYPELHTMQTTYLHQS